MSARCELRKLMERKGVGLAALPLLPVARTGRFAFGEVRYSQLDLCSDLNGGCDKCVDLVDCRSQYDSLC